LIVDEIDSVAFTILISLPWCQAHRCNGWFDVGGCVSAMVV
jgi:hypothetical protein